MPLPLSFRIQPRTSFVDESSPKKNRRPHTIDISCPKRHKPKNLIDTAKLGAQWGFTYQPLSPKETHDKLHSEIRPLFWDTSSSVTASTAASSDIGWMDFGEDSLSAFKSCSVQNSIPSNPIVPATKTASSDIHEQLPHHQDRASFTPRRLTTTRSILDQPFEFWQELNSIFVDAYPTWTSHERKKMIQHLVHFLELKIGMDEYVPTSLLMPTPIVEDAWRTLVLETFLYMNVLYALQDFHGRPRAFVHYTFRGHRLAFQRERIDKIRRTQSLFWLYFKEPMPVTIMDEHEEDHQPESPTKPPSPVATNGSPRDAIASLSQPFLHPNKQDRSSKAKAKSSKLRHKGMENEQDAPSDEEESNVHIGLGMMEI